MKRFGSAAWNGGLREGKGSVSTESRALENYPYSFFTRYGEKVFPFIQQCFSVDPGW